MRQSRRRWKRILLGERILLKTNYVCVTVLVLSQLLLLKPEIRMYLSQVDQLEGEQISLHPAVSSPHPFPVQSVWSHWEVLVDGESLTIQMLPPAKQADVFITVNGKQAGDFSAGTVQLKVLDGDYLEINAQALQERARFVIHSAAAKLVFPPDGLVVDGKEEIIAIGKIKFGP